MCGWIWLGIGITWKNLWKLQQDDPPGSAGFDARRVFRYLSCQASPAKYNSEGARTLYWYLKELDCDVRFHTGPHIRNNVFKKLTRDIDFGWSKVDATMFIKLIDAYILRTG